MDKQSMNRFLKLLKERRDSLQRRLTSATRQSRALADAKDEGDRASASIEKEMSAVEQVQAESLLKSVDAALARIDAGTFGQCLNCGQEIGMKRLEAIPWARYCITCQELMDHR
jgi:DnaK suppressor protein